MGQYDLPVCELCHSGLMARVIFFENGGVKVGLCCSCDNIHNWQFPEPDSKDLVPSEINYIDSKQTVWVALWASQMDASFVGVFSSRELAEEAAALYQEEQEYGDGYVEQWEIDGKRILV